MSILRPEVNLTQMEDIIFLYRYLLVDAAIWYGRNYIYGHLSLMPVNLLEGCCLIVL